jgi:hypothetical protein
MIMTAKGKGNSRYLLNCPVKVYLKLTPDKSAINVNLEFILFLLDNSQRNS